MGNLDFEMALPSEEGPTTQTFPGGPFVERMGNMVETCFLSLQSVHPLLVRLPGRKKDVHMKYMMLGVLVSPLLIFRIAVVFVLCVPFRHFCCEERGAPGSCAFRNASVAAAL